ncbi:DUF6338 family protein [Enterobacter kobei]|uniref:DUF6338 family protein n=1 Tax=Enterobacter kobei TaxID=208224 RepID=UPI002075EE7F|nr:DUF6338 family protein [Enterobacter kobei]MCM7097221.1 DUF6338 family protein [Enterobacter kobei]
MELLDYSKLMIFILFVIPGFISLKIYEILQPSIKRESSKLVIDAIAYSCINYAAWGIPLYYMITTEILSLSSLFFYIYLFLLLIIFPIINPIVLNKLRKCRFISDKLPHPTGRPWDYFFSLKQSCWVIVTMKDGSQVAGAYKNNAFASSCPEPEQIYLSEHWVLNSDGGFERPRNDTLGIIILSSEIKTLEFFKM